MKKTEKSKQSTKQTTKETKETMANALRRLARRASTDHDAERATRFGRWTPAMRAMERVVDATLDVAEEAVRGVPRQLAKVQHVRRAATARFAGDACESVDLTDVLFTVGLLVQLAEDDFGDLGLGTLPDTLLATLPVLCPLHHGLAHAATSSGSPHSRL